VGKALSALKSQEAALEKAKKVVEKAGVEDTGALTFHLRKMSEFLKKNERGSTS